MKCIRNRVIKEFEDGWIGPNTSCPYYPCHYRGQDCTYCYCPFYPCMDEDLGRTIRSGRGKDIWDCSECLFIHQKNVAEFVSSEVERMGIKDPDDPRLKEIFRESKDRYFRLGRSVMVLGATSDAGKSLTVTALCRIMLDEGYSVTPLKTQNMSLNSVVTGKGDEIAMIQSLQAKAAGISRPGHHINPILLKPKGNTVSQVMVHGRPFGDYDVKGYYKDFVPGPGIEAVKESIGFLRKCYDYVVIEGAGSPAEINIYHADIANMKAAELADADCILVVNTQWGGSFAYALGTLELLEVKDRERIKAVLFNNLYGDPENFIKGTKEFERISGIPVLGVIPHADLFLPNEDSAYFKGSMVVGDGKIKVSVVRLPRIANFTDIDPLYLEDVTVRFVERPEQLDGSDAIIIPGTKNTISDLQWLKETGMAERILNFKGKIPILGICGGYQMMGSKLTDSKGLEGDVPSETDGLGLFNNITEWEEYRKSVRQVTGRLLANGGEVRGYEIHMGETVVDSEPLFEIDEFKGTRKEGSSDTDNMLFGTYLHGVFDAPSFRRYFLSFASSSPDSEQEPEDYSEKVEHNIQKLADVFRSSMDMDLFKRLFMEAGK